MKQKEKEKIVLYLQNDKEVVCYTKFRMAP